MFTIRPLQKNDNRQEFRSGNPELDQFFHRYAGQNQFRHHIGVTYVAVAEERICGYATVASGSMEPEEVAGEWKGVPGSYPLPILRLGRLAVAEGYRRQGIGAALLGHVFLLAFQQKKTSGCVGVLVDAKEEAIPFYERYGFRQLPGVIEGEIRGYPSPVSMFLSIKSMPEPTE